MAFILSIETADKGCSVAVHDDGVLLSENQNYDGKSSSAALTLLIEASVKEAKLQYSDLSAIAVSKGPGSYTGLRIGVSTAKGMCYALEIPLISVNSLDTLAEAEVAVEAEFICPMLDARRMEVYCKLIDKQSLKTVSETEAMILGENSFEAKLKKSRILFCGPGSVKAKNTLQSPNAVFSDNKSGPHAKYMGKMAYHFYSTALFEDLVEFEPFYLKDFLVKKSKKKMPLDGI